MILRPMVILVSLLSNFALAQEDSSQVFKRVTDAFEKGFRLSSISLSKTSAPQLLDELRTLPRDAYWGASRTKVYVQLDQILDQESDIIGQSQLVSVKIDFNKVSNDLLAAQKKDADLKFALLGSAQGSRERETLTKNIADNQKKIDADQAKVAAIKNQVIALLKANGLNFNFSQVNSLLYTVTGSDDIDILSVYQNIGVVNGVLENGMRDHIKDPPEEALRFARKYYGTHVLLLRTLLVLHKNYVNKVDNLFVPNLKKIISSTEMLMRETERKLADTHLDQKFKDQYQSNLEDQKENLAVAQKYLTVIQTQKKHVEDSTKDVQDRFDLAENSFIGIDTANELIGQIRNARASYSTLMNVNVPEMVRFESREQVTRFQKLTNDLTITPK